MMREIKRRAFKLGFNAFGVTDLFAPTHAGYFLNWLDEKRYARMDWLGRNADKRLNPALLLEGARSAIAVAVSYKHEPPVSGEYAVARYAYGSDYHDWMRAKLDDLARFISDEALPGAKCRSFVDTGPVLERDLAAKAGIGWIGKNTCLVNRKLGSYVFLGVLFLDRELNADTPVKDLCAGCRLCLDACPTGALAEYRLDPARCLAYHNIELRGERPHEHRAALDKRLVGCDICQEVCPWNIKAPDSLQASWFKSFRDFHPGSLREILQMTPEDYKAKTKGSAVSRIKFEDFMRNVFLVIANAGRHDLKDDVAQWRARHPGIAAAEAEYCWGKL